MSWLRALLFGRNPRVSRKDEILRIKKALRRYEGRLNQMRKEWSESGAPCCPACMFGQNFDEVVDQIKRTEAWLKVLESKPVPPPRHQRRV